MSTEFEDPDPYLAEPAASTAATAEQRAAGAATSLPRGVRRPAEPDPTPAIQVAPIPSILPEDARPEEVPLPPERE